VAKLKQDIQLLKIFVEAVVTLASRTSLMRIWLAGRLAMWDEKGTVCHFFETLSEVLVALTSRTSNCVSG